MCPIEACPARRMNPVRITREAEKMIMIGAVSHRRTHTVVALDEVSRKVGQKTVSTDSEGHLQLLRWARKFEEVEFALEDCQCSGHRGPLAPGICSVASAAWPRSWCSRPAAPVMSNPLPRLRSGSAGAVTR